MLIFQYLLIIFGIIPGFVFLKNNFSKTASASFIRMTSSFLISLAHYKGLVSILEPVTGPNDQELSFSDA